jgi:hypothetical protein
MKLYVLPPRIVTTPPAGPFYFEYKDCMVMSAPETHFFYDIPDAPLPSLGGCVDGKEILAGTTPANDTLPDDPRGDSLP